jgi:hypothetical protein
MSHKALCFFLRRRRWWLALVGAVLLAGGLVWWFWPRDAVATAEARPERPSPLDAFDADSLSESAWPRRARPPEAVGVLELDKDATPVRVVVDESVIYFRRADGHEVGKIDGYAPPKPPSDVMPGPDGRLIMLRRLELSRGPTNCVSGAALAPSENGLVVFGKTTPGLLDYHSKAADWIQVWVADGSSLKPLEVQVLEDGAASAGAFSPDGTQLAMTVGDHTEVWHVRPEGVKRLYKVPVSGAKDFAFSADNRWLAVMTPDQTKVYDCDPVRSGGGGERFRHNLLWALLSFGLAAAPALLGLAVLGGSGAKRNLLALRPPPGAATSRSNLQEHCDGCKKTGYYWQPLAAGGGVLRCPCPFCHGLGTRPVAAVPPSRWARRLGVVGGVAGLGGLVCLAWWGWLACFAAPTLQTPAGSPLAETAAKAVTFSPDGRSLAAVLPSGDVVTFDVATGTQTGKWSMQEKVTRAEFAPDGRHLLGMTNRKAYVLRLRPFDWDAYILACCAAELKDDPGSSDALAARGLAYREKGDLDRAIADFTEAIRQDGSNATAYFQRGLTRADAGDLAGARADLAEAVRLGLDPGAKAALAPKADGKQR